MEKKSEHTGNDPAEIIKMVLFGPESTGKTTLSKQLAAHYRTLWVPEYMREYLELKWKSKGELVEREDLVPIAEGQLCSERAALEKVNNLLICDTNLLELEVYSKYYYDGFSPSFIREEVAKDTGSFYLLTYVDTPWEEDILRDRPNNREEMFSIFEAELKKRNLPYRILKGDLEERFKKATTIIDSML